MTIRTPIVSLALLGTLLVVNSTAVIADPADRGADPAAWPFFAFDNGVGRDQGWTPAQQAELTSRLGYDGIGYSLVDDLDARFVTCEANGQRVFSFYESFNVGADQPVDTRVLQNLPRLIQRLGEGDFDLVPMLRQLAASGYQGPIGLQCYQVRGKIDDNLKNSIDGWRRLLAEINPSS